MNNNNNNNIKEEIREIPGYNGKYLITNTGKVFSYGRDYENGKKRELKELRIFIRSHMPTVDLYDGNGSGKKMSVHKLLADIFLKHLADPNNIK